MGQFWGNFVTVLGGAGGILIGVAVIGIVVAFLAIPLLFIAKPSELGPPEDETHRRTTRV